MLGSCGQYNTRLEIRHQYDLHRNLCWSSLYESDNSMTYAENLCWPSLRESDIGMTYTETYVDRPCMNPTSVWLTPKLMLTVLAWIRHRYDLHRNLCWSSLYESDISMTYAETYVDHPCVNPTSVWLTPKLMLTVLVWIRHQYDLRRNLRWPSLRESDIGMTYTETYVDRPCMNPTSVWLTPKLMLTILAWIRHRYDLRRNLCWPSLREFDISMTYAETYVDRPCMNPTSVWLTPKLMLTVLAWIRHRYDLHRNLCWPSLRESDIGMTYAEIYVDRPCVNSTSVWLTPKIMLTILAWLWGDSHNYLFETFVWYLNLTLKFVSKKKLIELIES